ncbi:MAG: PEP-CTERM sorting domain-containing protein [Gemmatimonadaceae bacterium]|nr:PEP-CTERM sorting domain-containing protein [Gemmatimonadaceae bacterium]
MPLTPWEGTVGGNSYQVFNLGTMSWVNGNTSGYTSDYVTGFNLRLYLTASTYFDYSGAVSANIDDSGSNQGVTFDWINQPGNNNSNNMAGFPLDEGWRYFEADNKKYQFRILGFDTGNSQCGEYGDVSQFTQSLGSSSETKNICGKIEYVGDVKVSEPATFALVSAGLLGLVGVARRRREV